MTPDPVRFLIGDRIYLRPIEADDLPTVQRFINDPEIRDTLLMVWPLDRVAEERWHAGHDRGMPRANLTLAIVLRGGDRLIGVTGLHVIDWVNRFAETGTMIGAKELWGQGYATEAKALLLGYCFDTLGLNRMESHTFAYNEASRRHLEKNGYTREGVFRRRIFRFGTWHDTIHYGLLADEWRTARNGDG